MFSSNEINFGVVSIDNKNIKVYQSNTQHSIIHVGYLIKEARWVNNNIIVYLENGNIRKYKSLSQYDIIK